VEHLNFASIARNEFGLDAIEYVNSFFFDKAEDQSYLKEMKSRADSEGVKSLLIMCDDEGNLGDPDGEARQQAVENHHKLVRAAKYLGCNSIRVNARSEGSWEEQMKLATDGLRTLTEFGDEHGINVIVENHGGLSSNGQWLSGVIEKVDHPRCGTLPDFGNFQLGEDEWYDRYKGITELMPYAKAVSAKSHDFDSDGNEINTDYSRMMQIVLDAGYNGYVGIEYEGNNLSEMEGIRATKKLLERFRSQLR
jgi:sugar phosphate isomerase/epimerase